MIQAQRSQPDGAFLRLYCVFGDLKLEIELKEREVRAGHVAHKGQRNGALAVLGREQLGASRFGGAPQLAEEIELKRDVGSKLQQICFQRKKL